MKLMVSGIGGVGGYLSAYLCSRYPGDVTLVARGKRKKALTAGLSVTSPLLGNQTFHPAVTDRPAAAGIQDVIFICVKTFSLDEAAAALIPCADSHTIVVPVMNGIDHAERTQALLPASRIVNSLIYITSAACGDYSICHTSPYVRMFVDSPDRKAADTVCRLLHHPNEFNCTVPADMKTELWKKYIINCAYNTITAYYRCTTGGILAYPERFGEFRALLDESCAAAAACGISLPRDFSAQTFENMMHRRNADATSSMARDVLSGRKTELETFGGYLTRLAREKGLSVPMSERFYAALKERECGK